MPVRRDPDPDPVVGIDQPRRASGQHRGTAHERVQPGPALDQRVEVGDHPQVVARGRVEGGDPSDQLLHPRRLASVSTPIPVIRPSHALRAASAAWVSDA